MLTLNFTILRHLPVITHLCPKELLPSYIFRQLLKSFKFVTRLKLMIMTSIKLSFMIILTIIIVCLGGHTVDVVNGMWALCGTGW